MNDWRESDSDSVASDPSQAYSGGFAMSAAGEESPGASTRHMLHRVRQQLILAVEDWNQLKGALLALQERDSHYVSQIRKAREVLALPTSGIHNAMLVLQHQERARVDLLEAMQGRARIQARMTECDADIDRQRERLLSYDEQCRLLRAQLYRETGHEIPTLRAECWEDVGARLRLQR